MEFFYICTFNKCLYIFYILFCIFQVDVRFPQSGAADPNLVTVTGRPEQVDEAIDHLLNLEEEYVRLCYTLSEEDY